MSATVVLKGDRAVKMYTFDKIESGVREALFMKMCFGDYIVPLIETRVTETHLELHMPQYQGDLLGFLNMQPGPKSFDLIMLLALGIAGAIEHVHARGVIHCDIKPENILLDRMRPVLCDFGLSVLDYGTSHKSQVQSWLYRAPEVDFYSKECKYGPAIDVWSFGVILFALITGDNLFPTEVVYEDITYLICNMAGVMPSYYRFKRVKCDGFSTVVINRLLPFIRHDERFFSSGLVTVVMGCLRTQAIRRITMTQARGVIEGYVRSAFSKAVLFPPPKPAGGFIIDSGTDAVSFVAKLLLRYWGMNDETSVSVSVAFAATLFCDCDFRSVVISHDAEEKIRGYIGDLPNLLYCHYSQAASSGQLLADPGFGLVGQ